MLNQLYIKNFTLIDELSLEFEGGFSVITGETGAGKSIMLGALGLLLGQRADTKAIKNGCDRCVVEAHFDLSRYDFKPFFTENDIEYDVTDCILRREVTSSGKSRAFINDTPVALTTLRELGSQLVDIHSQHQNLLLNKEDFQLNVVDIIADNKEEANAYKIAYQQYRETQSTLEQLREQMQRNQENEDFIRFQHNELAEARLVEGEQEELEEESNMLTHAEEIKGALYEADQALSGDNGVVELLKTASHSLESIRRVYANIEETANRMESCYIELKDIASDLSKDAERMDFDPIRLEEVNGRLDTIYRLQQKYHVQTVSELIEKRDCLAEQLSQIDGSDEALQELEQREQEQKLACEQLAKTLSRTRQQAARKVEEEMSQRLIPLGIPNVRFNVQLTEKPLSADGGDKVSFLFSANSSTPPQPVSQVASGGEIARVMLALKAMISGMVKLPTIIFDEIDTGVSGKVAEMMAKIMEEMGHNNRQVISITHLPQIAARGRSHYKVYKEETVDGTVSSTRRLNDEERVTEIAQMLSGSNITTAAIKNAEELLKKS
ncbi:MAG: DNA repair protein RecN [Prevotella sp.]|nr:DNA repair protein RecN [Prevotella sp.]